MCVENFTSIQIQFAYKLIVFILLKMILIDVVGFNLANETFLCNEISILHTASDTCQHKMVSMPIPFECLSQQTQDDVSWTTHNQHGCKWYHDDIWINTIKYEEIVSFIKQIIK